jgi:pSer/pThr/pTyr-binding forkhead associated (FHA) protein
MDKIIILQNGIVLKEIELDKRQIVIGRDEKNVIYLSDLSVSRRHALLTCALDEYFIEDLGSTNGTLLNDRPVTKHILKNGDKLSVGEYVLSFVRATPGADEDDDPEKTQVICMRPQASQPPLQQSQQQPFQQQPMQQSPQQPFHQQPQQSSQQPMRQPLQQPQLQPKPFAVKKPAAAPMIATIKYFRGPKKGASEQINRSLYTLGKPGGDVAVIARRSKGFYLMKIGNSSVPTINDKKVDVGGGIKLNDGDRVEVGENAVEISFAS